LLYRTAVLYFCRNAPLYRTVLQITATEQLVEQQITDEYKTAPHKLLTAFIFEQLSDSRLSTVIFAKYSSSFETTNFSQS
jgi:hypothetical protein